jgi:hypothetical protein
MAAPPSLPRALAAAACAAGLVAAGRPASAQTLDDGFMLPVRQARLSVEYGRERWDRYWEGTLRRGNENVGTVTTRAVTATAAYGLTPQVSLYAALPYVQTSASQGVLRGQAGWQDAVLAAKVRVLDGRVAGRTAVTGLVLAGVAAPSSNYTPDFLPLSIGLGARRAQLRANVHAQDRSGLFVEGAAGHTWRSTVRLDRPAYYTDGRLTLSDEVAMPDVADFAASVGYQRGRLCLPVMLVAQRTLGGGDIRRQDMPFPSNRMDFTRLQVRAMYWLPKVPGVQLDLGAARTLRGRNVGQSTILAGGLTTAFHL